MYSEKQNSKLLIVMSKFISRYSEITPRENRYCILCDSHDIGNEFHLICINVCMKVLLNIVKKTKLKGYCNHPKMPKCVKFLSAS